MPQQPSIADRYRRFAAMEAHGVSPLYEQLALGVADDPELTDLLEDLPPVKRQPNLLFGAARHVGGTPTGFAEFRRMVLDNRETVVATMLARMTQTNEPARCAALYPLLASLPQPLALLEVGASAGLCLLPDRYAYDYDGVKVGDAESPLTVRCEVEGGPLPLAGSLTVAWRAGIDLNPLDVTDPDDVGWLRTLIWPEQHDRLERLDAAIAVAQSDPPRIVRGDLVECLADLAAQAPPDTTLVVFHSAVLNYLPDADRAAFVAQVGRLGAHWISQEGAGVLPGVTAGLRQPPPAETATFVLALDSSPVAFTAPHGGWMRWLPGGQDAAP